MVLAILSGILTIGAVALLVLLFAEKKRSSGLAVDLAKAGNSDDLRARALEQANIVADALVKRADESFQNREQLAQARLEAQLKPVADTLAKFQEQVVAVEKLRAEDSGGLKAQITALMEASTATQNEARKLSAALRRAQLAGFAIPALRLAEGGDASGARGAAYAAVQAEEAHV